MAANLDRYKKDLDSLIAEGLFLEIRIQIECNSDHLDKLTEENKAVLPLISEVPFATKYQSWYSEAKALIKQLLPDRLGDFVSHYEPSPRRKALDYETYRLADFLQGTVVRHELRGCIVDIDAAIPHMSQQVAILKAAAGRFESSLFDIRQLVTADLMDSELEAAKTLASHGFLRAAGMIAGVVLETHLRQVMNSHSVVTSKKNLTIYVLNTELKAAKVIDQSQSRFIEYLGDIRNNCGHAGGKEPLPGEIDDLIAGVNKVLKTIF